MSWTGKTIIGILLVAFGLCAFFGMFGIHLGGLIGLAIGIALACFGIKKLKEGRKGAGIIALIIGLMFLGASLPFLIGLAFAVACIYFGWKMIKKDDHHSEPAYSGNANTAYKEVELTNNFDEEWKDFMRKHRKDDDSDSSL
ncbi:MAG TPA: protein liaI [Bacillales bacterium]|nr:protein liaI [Bacillales bacterium]